MEVKNVCVIGMGFIGTTLAAVMAEAGFRVYGIEKDKEKMESLKEAKPHFHENGLPELLKEQIGKNLFIFTEIPGNEKIDAFIVSVATPVDSTTKKPNLDFVKKAIEDILPHLKEEQVVILRSTVPVGTSRNIVLPMLKQKCKNVYVSFCPERTIEGKAIEELKTLPQIVGGADEKSVDISTQIFSRITQIIAKTSSLEVAEIIKLINNSYRDFNFAFANQTALICKSLGLDANEVIEVANFGYSRSNVLHPGFVSSGKAGFVGGVCLEKDPHILADCACTDTSLIKAARELNESLVEQVFQASKAHLEDKKIPKERAEIFISGFAFKGRPETDDMRGSPTISLLNFFKKDGFKKIYGHDFVVKEDNIKKLGVEPCSIEEGFKRADVLIFMNNHKGYEVINIDGLLKVMKEDSFIFDGWQTFSEQIKKKDINYESIGYKKTKNRLDRNIN